MEEKRQGRYTVVFENPPLIRSYGAVVGQKESEGRWAVILIQYARIR